MIVPAPSAIGGGQSQSCVRPSVWRVSLSTHYVLTLCSSCVFLCVCMYAHVDRCQRAASGVFLLFLALVFETGSLFEPENPFIWFGCLAHELVESESLCSPNTRITDGCRWALIFTWVLRIGTQVPKLLN